MHPPNPNPSPQHYLRYLPYRFYELWFSEVMTHIHSRIHIQTS